MELSKKFNFDPSNVFIAGSSAGAETVLHAGFWVMKTMNLDELQLSKEFDYAGIISGAGAIMDLNLITDINKKPIMLFHGDEDRFVPYGTATHHFCPPNSRGGLMLFGSSSFAAHLSNLGESVELTTFKGGGHEYAGAYFYRGQEHVVNLLKKVVLGEDFVQFY